MEFSLRSCLSFSFVVWIILTHHSLQSECCIQKERLALLQIKQHFRSSSTPVEQDLFPSWGSHSHSHSHSHDHHNCCSWEGVTCRDRHITQLSMSSLVDQSLNCITSTNLTIKPWSLNLTIFHQFERLERLDVSDNCIGSFDKDEALCKLGNIQKLNLSYNQVGGKIPECINNSSSFQYLDLSDNKFSGKVPPGICGLKNLTYLNINDNGFNGEFPSCVGNLTSLQYLDLSSNQFNGKIPTGICGLDNLVELILQDNRFNGEFPSCVGNLTSLQYLWLSNNQFNGKIPSAKAV